MKSIDTAIKTTGWGIEVEYDDLVATFEYEVIGQTSWGDYQGDNAWLLKDGDRYGFLVSGYGSCSGCDALQSATGYGRSVTDEIRKNLRELRDEMYNDIRWFDDKPAASDWLVARGRGERPQEDWYWYDAEAGRKILEMLSEIGWVVGGEVGSLKLPTPNPETGGR